jgi:hypothetical protein
MSFVLIVSEGPGISRAFRMFTGTYRLCRSVLGRRTGRDVAATSTQLPYGFEPLRLLFRH